MPRSLLFALSALLIACPATGDDDHDQVPDGPDCTQDADADGLDDCAEAELGTDPELADTDGDGFDDLAELDCVSDPLDGEQVCYACGWGHGDPGDLVATGNQPGDVMQDVLLVDQCGEELPLYDLAGAYHLLFITTAWCGACKAEALELQDRTESIIEATGVEFSYAIILFQSLVGGAPTVEEAADYWADIYEPPYPVTSNQAVDILEATAYPGSPLPGKCVISPDMEILECRAGHGEDDWAADAINEHLAR